MSLTHQQQLIGQGTFGSVFLVRNPNHQPVAVKAIKKQSNQKIEDMQREISAGKLLKHKSIVQFMDTVEDEQNWYLIMEYIEGENLLQFVQRTMEQNNGQLNLPHAFVKTIFKKLVKGLCYAHKKGVAHLDIKLENIMIHKKSVKLIDFGLCHVGEVSNYITRFVGSPDYLSPEILLRQAYRPDKADVWSLGTILYALFTGEMPFMRNERKRVGRSTNIHPSVAFESDCNIPKQAKDLIERMLMVDPEQRPTMDEVRKHPWLSVWSL
mmetsp:Transcript_21465/g.30029  ORF Transcript_21465/g.30029 Transcript_21465/m.30029 type:complete len:267 (+) Transcript_21465:162-962(+)